ncbi:hypothetical protein Amet_1503 [Alkaliphilus metalliredigens QYMF]|uniref:EcsC protein n=1 Tax=Alkaliphilus metalliredigens (strain QYMF) TaxID=293826 RepID=A6TNC9_ALKMQ|nr:EcsC family protein [Alkaliphilus metalliredigens]ABR47697.1 hypothetical protein Amet_1503 [Alkaliphilus metalliredigens QYMF]
MDRELSKQFKRLNKIEKKMLNEKESKLFKAKIAPVLDEIQEKIPHKLRATLAAAFLKSFQLVFDKGNAYVEKTYNKDKIKLEHDLNNDAINQKINKKYIKRLDKQVSHAKMLNYSISILEGGVLGFFGIGLPDIPLFISVVMRTIYEIAMGYGYEYKNEEEKAYILLIICGALTQGDVKKEFNERIDKLGNRIDRQLKAEIELEDQMKETGHILSDAMLTAKFIQGIPFIGVVGGVTNFNIIKKIGKYASLKYKKRYLLKKTREKLIKELLNE